MAKGRTILSGKQMKLTIERLCRQFIENHQDFESSCIIGIQKKGAAFAEHLMAKLAEIHKGKLPDFGKLDVTFYRDDFRTHETPLEAAMTEIDFLVEGKRLLLVDDVLYTGRTIRAALDALQHYGRPKQVELVCLVDRRFNRLLPIQPDYSGITVDAVNESYVRVEWDKTKGKDRVLLFSKKEEV